MNDSDRAPLVAIAMLAAAADGEHHAGEQAAIDALVQRIGSPDVARLADQVAAGTLHLTDVAARLSDDQTKWLAYETALTVIHADGVANDAELLFLLRLRDALGLSAARVAPADQTAGALAGASVTGSAGAAGPEAGTVDELILEQAILTGALEVLPDRLANIAILPLQLRLVYQIGQRHGQKLDVNQVKDLAATLGLGAAAQSVEGAVMKVLGGLTGSLLGGLVGGATRVAAGAAVTFAATYALGHVADRYYAQGRRLSRADLTTLFTQFQREARTLYPRVEQRIQDRTRGLNLQSLLASLRAS